MAKLPFRLPNVGPRTRKVLQGIGYFVLALVTFVFAFQAVFPYDTARERIQEIASSKVDLTIDSVRRSWIPGRFYLEGVTIKTHAKADELEKAYAITEAKEREKAIAALTTTIVIDEVMVDLGILGLFKSTASIDFIASIDDGRIKGNLSVSKGGTSVSISGSDVPSDRLPMREVLSNLPMSGDVNFDFDLDLPNEKLKTGKTGPDWTKAVGSAEFECPNECVIGDGKAKLKLKAKNQRSQAFAGEGTDFGRVKLQSLLAKVELKDGKMDITRFDTKSDDLELHVDFSMTFAQNIDQSTVAGCLRFKGTDALRKREPKTYDQILLTGAARHTDGLDHIKLDGTFKEVKKLAKVCGAGVSGGSSKDNDTPSRPNLTVHPDEPTRPGSATPPPPINPPPPPTINAPTPPPAGAAGSGSAVPSVPHPATPTGAPVGSGSAGSAAGSGSGEPQAVPEGSANPIQ
jgi:type II secretion system protein N